MNFIAQSEFSVSFGAHRILFKDQMRPIKPYYPRKLKLSQHLPRECFSEPHEKIIQSRVTILGPGTLVAKEEISV